MFIFIVFWGGFMTLDDDFKMHLSDRQVKQAKCSFDLRQWESWTNFTIVNIFLALLWSIPVNSFYLLNNFVTHNFFGAQLFFGTGKI